jgi:anti-sigma factor RsiW
MMSQNSYKNTHPHGEQLSAYIDSMLDVSRMRGIGEHLHVCGACRSLESDLRRTKYLVRGLPDPVLPGSDFWTAAYRQLRVDDRERAIAKRPLWQTLRSPEQAAHRRWAAGLAAAAGVGVLLAGPLTPASHLVAPSVSTPPAVRALVPAQDVSPDVSSLAEMHTDSVSCLPLADPDRQKMIAADVQQPDTSPVDASEAAGYADASF